jgi:hypothetical protein
MGLALGNFMSLTVTENQIIIAIENTKMDVMVASITLAVLPPRMRPSLLLLCSWKTLVMTAATTKPTADGINQLFMIFICTTVNEIIIFGIDVEAIITTTIS